MFSVSAAQIIIGALVLCLLPLLAGLVSYLWERS